MSYSNPEDRLDLATSRRLAKLARRHMDTASLEQRLGAVLREQVAQDPPVLRSIAWQQWWRPLTSAAAVLVIMFTLGWLVLGTGTSPAMAAPVALAQIHYEVANGLAPHLKVSSVEEANQLLADQSSGVVLMPELPGVMMSCCLNQHAGTMLTCALIERDGQLITIALADGGELHSPRGQPHVRAGRSFTAHTVNGINMVMSHQGDRWMCVMGETTIEQLLEVAQAITF